jgi:hypothetical protein
VFAVQGFQFPFQGFLYLASKALDEITILLYSYFMIISFDGSLEELFAVLAGICRGDPVPDRVSRRNPGAAGLFALPPSAPGQPELFDPAPAGSPRTDEDAAAIEAEFFEASQSAYTDFIHARMSELPIERELLLFARRVITAAREAGSGGAAGAGSPAARTAAEEAATDRGDPAVQTVLRAAFKVRREIHRLMGFLRFSPSAGGYCSARCAPDYFILPALAEHFYRRFGETPWIIIDEKRDIALVRDPGGEPRLIRRDETPPQADPAANPAANPAGERPSPADPWETLWRGYHRAVNNEGRQNPALQKQFMPLRYRKYLPEMEESPGPCAPPAD